VKVTKQNLKKMGTGFDRIRKICKKENTPFPEITFNENYFYTLFQPSLEYAQIARTTEKVTEKVTENQGRILELIRKDKTITAKRLSHSIGISERKIKENLKKLKEKRLLQRVGPDKGGFWEIEESVTK